MSNSDAKLRLDAQLRRKRNHAKRYPIHGYDELTQTRRHYTCHRVQLHKASPNGTTDTRHSLFEVGHRSYAVFSVLSFCYRHVVQFRDRFTSVSLMQRTKFEVGDGDSTTRCVTSRYSESPLQRVQPHEAL